MDRNPSMAVTTGPRRPGRRVVLVARYPLRDPAMPQLISNHGMRMVEASLRASRLDGLEVHTLDLPHATIESLVDDVLGLAPDVVGFSAYIWSFPFFINVARYIKEIDPGLLIVFGGPSARPSMMGLEPFRGMQDLVDVLVINEGEDTFRDIVALQDRSDTNLLAIPGVAVHQPSGWVETPTRPLGDLNALPSPYRMGLVPKGGLGVLQTYRGCPFTCTFCEWGTLESPKRVRDVDDLCAEFSSLDHNDVTGSLLVDAGLNLNQHAFRNLYKATEKSGFFANRSLICEVYPAKVKQEHIDFLSAVGRPLVGVGLQSFDNSVLKHVERSYDEARFEDTLHSLAEVSSVAVEIIMGLPGDSPESFRKSFERARGLSCALRVYHCVVLPSALMVRAPSHYNMVYDSYSLKLQSCLGWSEEALEAEQAFLTREAYAQGGQTGDFFWVFPPPGKCF